MTKNIFLKKLSKGLSKLNNDEKEHYIDYYDEIISDLIDNGYTEDEAVAKQKSIDEIVNEILSDIGYDGIKKPDLISIILLIISVVLFIASIICMVVFPGGGTTGYVSVDNSKSIFVFGKFNEPIILYIITVLFFIICSIYYLKKHKKSYFICILCLMCVCGIIFVLRNSIKNIIYDDSDITVEESDEYWYEAKTKEIIELLNKDDFETLRTDYAADIMYDYLELSYYNEAKMVISPDWGEFISLSNIYASEVTENNESYTLVQVNATYENVGVTYTILFDINRLIVGLYMK